MPIGYADPEEDSFPYVDREEEAEYDYSGWDIIKAAERDSFDIGGVYRDLVSDPKPKTTRSERDIYKTGGFRASQIIEGTRHDTDERRKHFAGLQNMAQIEWQNKRFDELDYAEGVLMRSPWYQTIVPLGVASTLSPSSAVLGGPLYGGAKGAVTLGAKSLLATATQEGTLSGQQKIRPFEKSAVIVGGSTFIGTGMGAFLGKGGVIGRNLDDPIPVDRNIKPADGQSVGAMENRPFITIEERRAIEGDPNLSVAEKHIAILNKEAEQHTLVNAGVVKWAGLNLAHRFIPEKRATLSKSPSMRKNANMVLNHGATTEGNQRGLGQQPLEELTRLKQKKIEMDIPKIFDDGYINYSKNFNGEKMKAQDFDWEVWIAATEKGKHEIPQVADAAKKLVKAYDEQGVRLEKSQMMEKNAEIFDESYAVKPYSRGYAESSTPKQWADPIIEGRTRFLREAAEREMIEMADTIASRANKVKLTAKNLEGEITELKRIIKLPGGDPVAKARARARLKIAKREKKVTKLPEQTPAVKKYYDSLTEKEMAYQRVRFEEMRIALASGRVPSTSSGGASYAGMGILKDADGIFQAVKSRTLEVPSKYLPKEMFQQDIRNAVVSQMKRTERQMTAYEDGRLGDASFSKWREERIAEFEAEKIILHENKAGLEAGKIAKNIKKLIKQKDKDLKDINGFTSRYNGIRVSNSSAAAHNVTSAIMADHAMSKLGRAIFAQMPEILATLGKVGVKGHVKLVVGRIFAAKEMQGLSKRVLNSMAAGHEASSGLRHLEKGIFDETSPALAKMINKVADFTVDKIFMIGLWTRHSRRTAAIMIQDDLGDRLLRMKFATDAEGKQIITGISKIKHTEINQLGLTDDMLMAIAEQNRKHHTRITGGTIDMHLEKWDNQVLADRVITAIAGDSKHYQLEAGIGSMPFMGDKVHGALLFQFKSFLLMATSKHLMNGVQKMSMGDVKAFEQIIGMTVMGSVGYKLRAMSMGKGDDDDWDTIFREGAIRSGFGGLLGDGHSFIEQITGGRISAFRLLGMEPRTPSQYWGTKNIEGMILGPTGQVLGDLINIGMGLSELIADGTVPKSMTKSVRRHIPFGNFVGINTPIFRPIDNFEEYLLEKYN